jgi:thiol-disulfide isomerase/thioredoxin
VNLSRSIPFFLSFVLVICIAYGSQFAQAAEEARKDVYHIPAEKIASVIDKAKGKRAAVVIYASWCPYCRKVMPEIAKMAKAHEGQVIAISVDKDVDTFKRYLDKNFGQTAFLPIVWDQSDILAKGLSRFGIKPGRGIPFTALLDEYGFVHKQGVLNPKDVNTYLSGGNI